MCRRLVFVLVMTAFSCGVSCAAESPNVLLICVDDLRPELRCFGVEHMSTPHIDALAKAGRAFHRHYVQAPTCGASRYALLTGTYGPAGNGALFQRASQIQKDSDAVPPSLPATFRKNGYTTVSVGKVSHHPGGRGGPDWDDKLQLEMPRSWDRHLLPAGDWQHPRGWMHGLANGEIRVKAGEMDVLQATEGGDEIYPDGNSINEALNQIELLADDEKPFFLAVGILRPHLPFGAPKLYHDLYIEAEFPPVPHPLKPTRRTTWHGSGEFMKYNRWGRNPNSDEAFALVVRKAYAACVSYADAQVGKLIAKLMETNLQQNTIVVLWGDHGWHLGEHAIWGKHALFEESLRSPLVVVTPKAKRPGVHSDSIVETIDVYPTLCELAGIAIPEFLDGKSLSSHLKKPQQPNREAISYAGRARTIRTNRYRMILHNDGYVELYDHTSSAGESINVASSKPEVVEQLQQRLKGKLGL
ncbi:MAG: sulfatase [Pirellulales bacterium]|nr:sulfatase [Pirellulales bacterium]